MISFEKCICDFQLKATAELANEIWNEYFLSIISQDQIDYMVDKFQSFFAMKQQINEGYSYYNIMLDGNVIGYFAVCPKNDGTLFLSKLYLKKEYRGRGYASLAFSFIKGLAKGMGLKSVWLTVNIHNDTAISAYNAFGMKKIRSQIVDIGEGFVMDDFVFEISV